MKRKKRYLMQMIVIIISVFLVFNTFSYLNIKQKYKNRFYEIGDKITVQTAKALTRWVENQVRVVKIISNDKRIIDACRFPENEEIVDKAQNYLQSIHRLYPYYENLPLSVKVNNPIEKKVNGEKVLIRQGEFLIDTVGGKTIGEGGMHYSYIKEIFNGKDYFISQIYPSILRENPIFVISAPVIYNSEIIGVAMISPKIDYFTETFVDDMNFQNTGYMFFLDDRNLTIAHPNRNNILSNLDEVKKTAQNIIEKISKGQNYFQANFLGETKLYTGREVALPLDHVMNKWYIVFTQTEKEILQNANSYLKLIIFMGIIATIIVVWAMYLISEINQRELYKEKLEEINKSLEKKVQKRTKALRELAIRDSLTQLYNHQASYNILEKTLNKAKKEQLSLVVIMADLDRFKKVNDIYGHQVGDEVLKITAQIISSNIRKEDKAGRYGGEEFIMILPNTTLEKGLQIANKIKESISNAKFSEQELKITISMGVCQWNGESSVELVNLADEALYRAKKNGRNRIEIG